ncbi:MAG TPA: FkbM family methyltransferase [Burkholderiaceae bacterium]
MARIKEWLSDHPAADAASPAQPAIAAEPVTDAREGGRRVIETNIGGKPYRIASDDDYLDHVKGEFEPHMVKLFRGLIDPHHTIFDIGANIGCTSILFSDMGKRVFSFEPSPSTYAFLALNIDTAQCGNVTATNVGLGKEAGNFELTFAKSNRSGAFVSNVTSASQGHQIERIEIAKGDSFVTEHHIEKVDFLKIDVEGFERNVIEGLQETIRRDRPVVVLELNHWCLNVFQRTSVPDFLDFLRGIFPYLFAVDGDDARNLHDPDHAYHVMYHHIVGGLKYANLVGAFDRRQLERFASAYHLDIA